MRRTTLALALSLLVLGPGGASALELGAKAAYWLPQLSGEFRLDSGSTAGTPVDFDDDLGFDDENFFFGEAWVWIGDHHLTLSGTRVDYSGDRSLSQPVTFGGQTFVVGGRVESALEYTMLDLAYQYDLLDLENVLAGFSLGPILQVKYLDGEIRMAGDTTVAGSTVRREESESFQIPLPMVGLGGHLGILADWIEVRARAVGIAYQGDSIIELLAEVSVTPFPFLEVVGGYRHFAIDVDRDDVLLDYTQSGPYVGAGVVF